VYALETEKEWLELRKTVVTATEAAVLLGQNKYMTPNQMYREKTEGSFKGNAYTKMGQLLEKMVISETNEKLNRQFLLLEQEGVKIFYKHPEVRLGATPDAIEDEVLLECKSAHELNYLRYKYSPPKNYLMQLQTQLYCAGFQEGYLAIMSRDAVVFTYEGNQGRWINEKDLLEHETNEWYELKDVLRYTVDGSKDIKLAVFHVTKDQRICELLKEEVERFWDTIEKGKMFRINAGVKREVSLRLNFCYEKVI
jgi:putative phage-type endonuclease